MHTAAAVCTCALKRGLEVSKGGADLLDSVISTVAGQAGFAYAEVRGGFSGHEICDSSSWLHSVDWLNLGDSYHPTASGQSGAYYPVFSAAA